MQQEDTSGKVISFINMKGGVGKTTLCIGMADYLANYMDKRILVLDLDPQFNATQSFLYEYKLIDEYLDNIKNNNSENKTITKIFDQPDNVHSLNKNKIPGNEIITKLTTNLDIVYGNINLIFNNNSRDASKIKRVKKFINENSLKNEYDFIFIDCPPTISMYTDAALVASDYYITPIKIDQYSLLGVTSLNKVIDDIKYNEELSIKLLGAIYTHIENEMTEKTRNLKDKLEIEAQDRNFIFFKNVLQFNRDLMVGKQGNIASKYNKSRADLKALSEEFLSKINEE